MSRPRRAALAVLLALSALWAGAGVAAAHAMLVGSNPAADAVLATAPTAVVLTFSEPPDPRLSSVAVLDASGADHVSGPAAAGGTGGVELTVPVGPLGDGVYTVAWRSVSAVDGHAAAGSFAFTVGPAVAPTMPSPQGAAGASSPSPAAVLARTAMYLGLVLLLGSLVTGEALLGPRARAAGRLRPAAWLLTVGGIVALFLAQAADAGVAPADALASSLGTAALARLLPVLLAGAALAVGSRTARWHRGASALAGALVAASLLADAGFSHAAESPLPVLSIVLQWTHAVGVAVWLGGLAGLLLELRDPDLADRARLVRRFSRLATAGILVVGTTGIVRAASELHAPGDLVSTDYGRLVLAKVAVFTVIAALGAANHFGVVPAGDRQIGRLRRIGSAELLAAATAVVLASTLVSTAPPGAPAPLSSIVTVQGSDDATTVRVSLEVFPATPGRNAFRATVADYDTGAPSAASAVGLRFELPARPGVAASTLDLAPAGDGTFQGAGANLAQAATWTVTALVAGTSTSVEVPMTLTVAFAPGTVSVSRVPGKGSVSTVYLGGGDSAQVYLDEWATGAADLHVTFFDPDGTELPVTGITATTATRGATPAAIPMTPVEPGHAIGHVLTSAGVPIAVAVAGTGPGGGAVAFDVQVTPVR